MIVKNIFVVWGSVSQILYWLIVLLIFVLGVVGLIMGELFKILKYFWVYIVYKLIGIIVLVLVLFCLGWCLYVGVLKLVLGVFSWQECIVSVIYVLLYVLMFVILLLGWLYDLVSGLCLFCWFGLVDVFKLSGFDLQVVVVLYVIYEYGFWLLIVVVLVYVGVVFYYYLFQCDVMLFCMLLCGWFVFFQKD